MLSRVADSLYWINRYVERAEFQARILETRHLGNLVESGQVLHVEQHVFDGGDVAHEFLQESIQKKRHPAECLFELVLKRCHQLGHSDKEVRLQTEVGH